LAEPKALNLRCLSYCQLLLVLVHTPQGAGSDIIIAAIATQHWTWRQGLSDYTSWITICTPKAVCRK